MVGEPHRSAGYAISFVITSRLFLWGNAPISLSFCFLYVQKPEAPSENPAGGNQVYLLIIKMFLFKRK